METPELKAVIAFLGEASHLHLDETIGAVLLIDLEPESGGGTGLRKPCRSLVLEGKSELIPASKESTV